MLTEPCAVERILPIPAQAGATIRMPGTFALRPGTGVRCDGGTAELTRGTRRTRLALGDRPSPALRRFLDGEPLAPDGHGVAFEALCRTLLLNGMASEPGMPAHAGWTASHGDPPGPNLVALIADLRDEVRPGSAPGFALQRSIIAGDCPPPLLAAWFLENYHYVRSAPHHCSPVLDHEMPATQRDLWRRFLFEESWHWRIFRPMFSAFGWPWDEHRSDTPGAGTRELTEVLAAAARTSPVVYGATLLLTEQVPKTKDVRTDPLYRGALTLGVPERVLRPLWWHAWSQCPTAHRTLGAMIISQQDTVPAAEAAHAVAAFQAVYAAVGRWGPSIAEENRTAARFTRRTGLPVPVVLEDRYGHAPNRSRSARV